MAQLLSDDDIGARLSADDAADWMREAVLLHHFGG